MKRFVCLLMVLFVLSQPGLITKSVMASNLDCELFDMPEWVRSICVELYMYQSINGHEPGDVVDDLGGWM